MTTQPTTSIEERVSRLEGSYERIGDLARAVEGFRAETNVRFESILAEIRAARADSDAKSEAMRREMNERFRGLTTVLTAAAVVLSTVLVGLTGAIIGLYARVG